MRTLHALLGCGGIAWAFLACVSADDLAVGVGDSEEFALVSNVLERRCGSLDCHGDPARNLRVYGRTGLRAAGQDRPGARATTAREIDETWRSLVLVDPEGLEAAREDASAALSWLPLAKGSGRMKHEGGVALGTDSDAEACLVSWARGALDTGACLADEFGPIPLPGEEF